MSDTNTFGYKGKLFLNNFKKQLMEDMFLTLENGEMIFQNFFLKVYGSLTPQQVSIYINEEQKKLVKDKKSKDNESKKSKKKASTPIAATQETADEVVLTDSQLVCAMLWFVLIDINSSYEAQCPSSLKELFTIYYGESPNEKVIQFFDSNYDTVKYKWVDMRCEWVKLKNNDSSICKMSKLEEDFTKLIDRGLLPLSGEFNQSFASNFLGNGEKENVEVKVNTAEKVREFIGKDFNKAQSDLRRVITASVGLSENCSYDEFKNVYSKKKPNIIEKFIQNGNSGDFGPKNVKALLDYCNNEINKSLKGKDYSHNYELRKYFENLGILFINTPTTQNMLLNAFVPIFSVRIKNYKNILEKLELKKQLSLIAIDSEQSQLLDDYFTSKFYQQTEKYLIKRNDVSEINEVFEKIDELGSVDAALEYFKESNFLDRKKDPNLISYLYSVKNKFKPKELELVIKYRKILHDIESKKLNPITKSNAGYTFGPSGMTGKIFRKYKNGELRTYKDGNRAIWFEIDFIRNGKLEKHHSFFYSARFYQEIFAYNPDSSETIVRRTRRFGYDPYAHKNALTTLTSKSHKKAIVGLVDGFKNVPWPEKEVVSSTARKTDKKKDNDVGPSFTIRRVNNDFTITVNWKFEKPAKHNFDTHVAYDLNQTASTGAALIRKDCSDNPHRVQQFGNHYCIDRANFINSTTSSYDQLSYMGVDHSTDLHKNWISRANKYILSLNNELLNNEFIKIKHYPLYVFNKKYHLILKKLLNCKFQDGITPNFMPENFRQELLAISSTAKGSGSILRLGSLDFNTFDALRHLKSLVLSYFGRVIPNKDENTEEGKLLFDPEIYSILLNIRKKITNKRLQKKQRNASGIINMAVEGHADTIHAENNLPVASNGVSKSQNNARIDWCARGTTNQVESMCKYHNIFFKKKVSLYSSHYDPSSKEFGARFKKMKVCDINDYDLNKLKIWFSTKKIAGTALYYKKAIDDFLKEYIYDSSSNPNLSFEEFTKIFMDMNLTDIKQLFKQEEIYMPWRGGRIFFSTSPLGSNLNSINIFGKDLYPCYSDLVAPICIFLNKSA